MHIREPKPRSKPGRGWYVRWGGKDHYLASTEQAAHEAFYGSESTHPASKAAWASWAAQRRSTARSTPSGGPQTTAHRNPASRHPLTVVRASALLHEHYITHDRPQAAAYFVKHLRRFVHAHAFALVVDLTTARPKRGVYNPPIVPLLQAYVDDISTSTDPKLSPKTINHDITAVQRLFNFLAERGLCPSIDWRGLKKLRAPRPPVRVHTETELASVFEAVEKAEPRLLPYMALCYLACLRPSEAVRVLLRQGRFEPIISDDGLGTLVSERGLFILDVHKNSWRQSGDAYGRTVVLTDEALEWLDRAKPHLPRSHPQSVPWRRLDTFSSACIAAGLKEGPRKLRKTAASDLRRRGTALEDVRTLLGHVPTGEWRSYAQIPWNTLRTALARISLRAVVRP